MRPAVFFIKHHITSYNFITFLLVLQPFVTKKIPGLKLSRMDLEWCDSELKYLNKEIPGLKLPRMWLQGCDGEKKNLNKEIPSLKLPRNG